MKSYSIQQKPCQFIAEGCSYQLQRYKNNLKKQMILQENRKIDRNRLYPAPNNWRESHSRFYPSPFRREPLCLLAFQGVKEQIESPKTTNPERAKTSKKGEGW